MMMTVKEVADALGVSERSVWVAARDPEDPERRLFLPLKSNLAADVYGMAYRVESCEGPVGVGIVAWDREPVLVSADDALAAAAADSGRRRLRGDAAERLRERLTIGPVPVAQTEREADDAGFSEATLKRAKPLARAESHPGGFGEPWVMELRPRCGAGDRSVAQL